MDEQLEYGKMQTDALLERQEKWEPNDGFKRQNLSYGNHTGEKRILIGSEPVIYGVDYVTKLYSKSFTESAV